MAPSEPDHQAAELLIPIGQYLGQIHDHPGQAEPPVPVIRVGGQVQVLTAAELLAWGAAQRVVRPEGTARSGEDPAIGDLIARGLLITVETSSRGLHAFATTHRVIPVLPVLGNQYGDPTTVWVGAGKQPAVAVSMPVAELLLWAPVAGSLWAAAEFVAAVVADATTSADPANLLYEAIGALPTLLAGNAVFVDLA